jgi:hypothetical protein
LPSTICRRHSASIATRSALEVAAPEDVESQHVRAHFVSTGGSSLELLEATSPESPDRQVF